MRERLRIRTLGRLVAVQRAARAGAEASLADAREDSESTQAAERDALADSEQAQTEWLHFVSGSGFSPEYSRVLAGRAVQREAQAEAAAARARAAERMEAQREDDWRNLQAQVRASEEKLRRGQRRVARRQEEQKLADMADRITQAWKAP